ncbi:hypothetical protein BFP97_11480 [Roseivirga sp. 4D4]|uniref:hypothetical protein n=1 Tax=Roseivirga sp. 4D4 TaxID=1889784 RepID=UPI0008535CA7|nr:hypothetical protein [Roseivirga sp. 4D4]OEK02104.1 hypothetical protein BFP97_11480 [Roseivirga sp. 4D4]
MDQYSRVRTTLTTGTLFLMVISACSVSRNSYAVQSPNNKVDSSQKVINVAPATMVKDAIRLQGLIMSVKGKKDGWYQYQFQVNKTLKYGATFASIEPQQEEVVVLNTSKKLDSKPGDEIIVDVTTPRERHVGKLMIFKVSE